MNLEGHLPMIPVHDVAVILGGVNDETASKWLKQNGIPIHKMCKKKNVFQIQVDIVLGKLLAKDLMKNNPKCWEEKYQLIAKDQKVYQYVVKELNGENWLLPNTTVLDISDTDKKLRERLKA